MDGYTDGQILEPPDPWENLKRTIAEIKAMGPVVVRFWFIDSPAEYSDFLRMIPEIRQSPGWYPGIGVFAWESRRFDPERELICPPEANLQAWVVEHYPVKKVWPWVCKHPGIWAEMSDGTWQNIKLKNSS